MADRGSAVARSDGRDAKSRLVPGCHVPGPWRVDPYSPTRIEAPDAPKGPMFIAEARGWGHLTGRGHGALALPDDVARSVQDANALLIAAAPDMLDALEPELLEAIAEEIGRDFHHSARAASLRYIARRQRAAIAKALPPQSPGDKARDDHNPKADGEQD